MVRWTHLYDELAGPRYPALLAYAGLLTGDSQAVDALVASALRRTFARPRRWSGIGAAEHEVRRAIVAGFLSRAPAIHVAEPATDHEPAGEPSAPAEAEVAAGAGTASNPYAPPAPGDFPSTSAEPPFFGDPHAKPDPASTGVTRATDEKRLRETVLTLAPQARAAAVLRHLDGLTPGQISERLDLPTGTVSSLLAQVRDVVRRRLDIVLPENGQGHDGAGATEVTVADHVGRP